MKQTATKKRILLERVTAAILALVVWAIIAKTVGSGLLMAGPLEVLRTAAKLAATAGFWRSVWFSFGRITAGFLAAVLFGTLLAVPAAKYRICETLLRPYMAAVKAVPVASFIILCLIWMRARNLSVVISFLIVLPIVYSNVLTGIRETDPKLLEAATLFRMNAKKKLKYIYLPQLRPYLRSALSVGVGMAWKAGAAAEVIGIPAGSIGEKLYLAKVHFDTAELFAWTLAVVLISVACEKAVQALLERKEAAK